MFSLNCLGKTIVPGSTDTAIGLKPKYLATTNEKQLSYPPDKATTAV